MQRVMPCLRRMLLVLVLGVAPGLSAQVRRTEALPTGLDSSLRAFLLELEVALVDMLNGSPAHWLALVSGGDDVTLFTPSGGVVRGRVAVEARYRLAAGRLVPSGATAEVEYLAVHHVGTLATVVGVERSRFRMAGDAGLRTGYTRVTHVIRREAGTWRLLHRHMDHLEEGG